MHQSNNISYILEGEGKLTTHDLHPHPFSEGQKMGYEGLHVKVSTGKWQYKDGPVHNLGEKRDISEAIPIVGVYDHSIREHRQNMLDHTALYAKFRLLV